MLRFASLGSGSQGNATLIEAGKTCLMIDNGFTLQETEKRLDRLSRSANQITAILVTHEHGDHISGVGKLARKYRIPVYLTEGTRRAAQRHLNKLDDVIQLFHTHATFQINDLEVSPITVPHDANEPSQFVFSDGENTLGVLTDTGSITPHIVDKLNACDALIIESNHDETMLAESDYPYSLKQRIAGRLGHLGNQQAADLLTRIDTTKLKHLIAAHLSEQNNAVYRVQKCLSDALNCTEEWISIADQENGFAWREITNRV